MCQRIANSDILAVLEMLREAIRIIRHDLLCSGAALTTVPPMFFPWEEEEPEPVPIGPCPFCGATRWDTSSAGKRTWNCGTGRWGNPFKPESIMFSQSARCQRWQKEEGHAKE